MQGFDALSAWVPEMAVSAVQAGADLPASAVREAIAITLMAVLFMSGVRLCFGLLGGVADLFAGRSHVLRRDGGVGGLRKLTGLAVVAYPAWNLVQIATEGAADPAVGDAVIWLSLAWLALRAADHRAVWLDQGEAVVRARRGFGVFRRTEVELPLAASYIGPGGARADKADQLKDRSWRISEEAVKALAPFRGGEAAARTYLRQALLRMGGRTRKRN